MNELDHRQERVRPQGVDESRLRLLIDQAADAVYLSDMQGRIVEVNQRAVDQVGYTREELLQKTVMDLDEDHPTLEQCLGLWSGLKIGEVFSFESRHVKGDGSTFPVEVRASAIEIGGEKLILGFVHDISERKKAEEQLKITQFGIDHAQVAVFQADDDANIYYANEQACRDLGYSLDELKRLTIMDINPTFDLEKWRTHRKKTHARGVVTIETTHRRKDGSEFPVEVTINRMVFKDKRITFSFAKDISERKRSEEERRRFDEHVQKTQKLESLGVLAGGIAHDFNNLLGGIYGYVDLAKEASKDETVSQYLAKALSTIDRARGLTRQLLTFSKGGEPVKQVMPLFPFVEETVRFALSGSRISCRFDVPNELWPCDYDSNQVGQVVDNIVINAHQAMPLGGTLTVEAKNVTLEEREHPALQAGGYVKLSFRDSGVGMPKEMLSRIFDPFFTTKQAGSGLGLATCYSIVKRHNGHIEVASEPGKGATFLVYLPAAAGAPEPMAAEPSEPRRALEERGRILIMDDERVIRDTTRAVCRSLGYEAVSTSDGQEVARVFADEGAAGHPFAAVILDLTVPGGTGGGEAIHLIRKIDPDVPVFVSSGYADDPVMANPTQYGFTGSLCKPFTRSELAELLRRHLES